MASKDSEYERTLDQTPTWAVAGVCAVIILVSLGLEKVLHKIGSWLTKKHKKALHEALDIVKAELMILGFISLLLVFFQYYIVDICIPTKIANTMLPCKVSDNAAEGRKLQKEEKKSSYRNYCKKGTVSLISVYGMHEIHILIFFMAIFHLLYSAITMALGKLKMRGWKQWEDETSSHDYEFSNDPTRFRLAHETSFVRAHSSAWARIPFFFYIGCFFRQFFRSVSKSDYLTLRNGFIAIHLAPGTKFNFQKYIKRSLEDDFKTVVGVSPVLWGSFVVFLLLNVNGWYTMFWASLIPVVLILAIGTHLQAILTKMAIQITDRHAVVQGIPLVQASDQFFWFNRPRLLLHLIHFSLFQNAFQVTYYVWIWYDRYGIKECYRKSVGLVIGKIGLGLAVLLLCSYITLPLYALITQMGSHMKKSIFDEQTSAAIKNWHGAVKKRQGNGTKHGEGRVRTFGDGAASPASSMGSPFHPTSAAALHRYKTTGHSAQMPGYGDHDHDHDHFASDLEDPATPHPPTASLIIRSNPPEREMELGHIGQLETRNEDDFSFAKDASNKK